MESKENKSCSGCRSYNNFLASNGGGCNNCGPDYSNWRPHQKHKVTRPIFICVLCEGIYADEPVSECDCQAGAKEFIEGIAEYTRRPQ